MGNGERLVCHTLAALSTLWISNIFVPKTLSQEPVATPQTVFTRSVNMRDLIRDPQSYLGQRLITSGHIICFGTELPIAAMLYPPFVSRNESDPPFLPLIIERQSDQDVPDGLARGIGGILEQSPQGNYFFSVYHSTRRIC